MKTSHHSIRVKTSRLLNRKETGGWCSTTGYSWQTRAARLSSSSVDKAIETWTACPCASMSFSSLRSSSSSSSICCSSGGPPGTGTHLTLTCCCLHMPAERFHLCAGQRDTKRDTVQWTDMWNGETWGEIDGSSTDFWVGLMGSGSASDQSALSRPDGLKQRPWGFLWRWWHGGYLIDIRVGSRHYFGSANIHHWQKNTIKTSRVWVGWTTKRDPQRIRSVDVSVTELHSVIG